MSDITLLESIAALAAAGAIPYLLLRGVVRSVAYWAAGAMLLHLVVGNLLNRFVVPAFRTQPTGVDRIPEIGETMQGSLAEYDAVMAWLHHNLLLSLATSLALITLGCLWRRRLARVEAPDPAEAGEQQVVGATCAACDRPILFATDGARCDICEAPLHHDCEPRHRCPDQRDPHTSYR